MARKMTWGPSNPLWRWQHRKSSKSRSVKPMARRFRRYSPRRARHLARRYYPRVRRFHRIRKGPLPILPIVGGVVAPLARSFTSAGGMANLQSDPVGFGKGMLDQISQRYAGISIFPEMSGVSGFQINPLIETYGGLAAGIFGHWLCNRFGVNRYMKRIPFVGKWIAF